jgi:hypothetical protein
VAGAPRGDDRVRRPATAVACIRHTQTSVTHNSSTANEEAGLPGAVDQLYAAVAALIDPVKELVNGTVLAAPSPYDALVSEIPAKSGGDAFSRGVGRSLPTIWCDAVDLRTNIDTRAKAMHPQGGSTPDRLRALAAKRWRPQDTAQVRDHATEIESWRISIRALLEPEHVKQIAAPCPSCDTRYVYKTKAGEQVRQAALQLVADQGCTCQNPKCRATWLPAQYLFLCKLLGFDVPAGVLD